MVALRLGMMVLRNEVIVGLDRRHQLGIAGDQNDKTVLAWVSSLVRMLNDAEQITGFDRDHPGLAGNALLKLKDLVLACAPAQGLRGNTRRPCMPFVIRGARGLVAMACLANPHPVAPQPPASLHGLQPLMPMELLGH
ncbi:MAG: hypothetical protein ACK550_17000 [Synechococcaceae cyanobacterium]